MANKMTKREMFTMIMAQVQDNADMVAFLEHEIELLDKKASSKKATKTQVENESTKTVILDVLKGSDVAMTITEMQSANSVLGELSNQKVSALVRQLVNDGTVVKVIDKKKSLFKIA